MNEWWQDFFASEAWQAVQSSVHPQDRSAEQAERIAELLELRDGDAVLDAPCGTGRIGIELAQMGARVTGVDITEPFLARARADSAARGVEAQWLRGDLRELPVGDETFDAAVCFWGSFGYFGPEGDRQMAAEVARALKPGGRWLIDTHSTETLMPMWASKGWWADVEPLVLEEREYNLFTGQVDTTWTFVHSNGRRDTHTSSVRLYAVHELIALLGSAGFTGFAPLGDLHGEPFEIGAHRLAMVALK